MSQEKKSAPTPAAEAFTELLFESFRFHGMLLAAGDRLTKDLGLTSALLQVLGSLEEGPLTMAQIGRNMGRTRQSVRRSVKLLEGKGMVEARDNPDHRRAMLIASTPKGHRVLDEVNRRHNAWANALTQGLDANQLAKAVETLRTLEQNL
ncbi:MAG: MarR family transcriptional regulator [Desulfarculaceae bacterium]|nr:MarR family transcriptional regulator [Desulfarculaceae bacterium]MCF8072443.1 MarR family transcriptional regulator [Desulfarculaceae bacterium]MCF8102904.1 MarR family transcriptional regulator [Desulfarculaceae bacterium]MCF8118486.1 MarR family transcriptional regulator [Desulfarculaceae bacterium]